MRERLKRVAAESAAATGLASLRDQLDSSVRNARRLDDLVRNVRATQRAAAVQAAQATNMRQQQEAAKAALAEEDAEKAAADAADRRREEQNSWSKERNALRYVSVVYRDIWYSTCCFIVADERGCSLLLMCSGVLVIVISNVFCGAMLYCWFTSVTVVLYTVRARNIVTDSARSLTLFRAS